MSRISSDQNQWGAGDLNGTPSSIKTNESTHIKRYGPLGVAGVSGVVNNHGGRHEVVFELTGDEILTENGVPVALALPVNIPANALVTEATVIVHEPFGAASVVTIDMARQNAPGAGITPGNIVPGELIDVQGVTDVVVLGTGVETFELGGTMTIDFTSLTPQPASKAGGRAEVIIQYIAL